MAVISRSIFLLFMSLGTTSSSSSSSGGGGGGGSSIPQFFFGDQTDSIPTVLFNFSDPEHQYTYFGGMRRKWTGESKLFKDLLDQRTGTIEKKSSSSMEEIAAKKGEHVWMYKAKVIKGFVRLSAPSGEVCCQGNKLQQQAYYNILLDFTEAWDQPLRVMRGSCG